MSVLLLVLNDLQEVAKTFLSSSFPSGGHSVVTAKTGVKKWSTGQGVCLPAHWSSSQGQFL